MTDSPNFWTGPEYCEERNIDGLGYDPNIHTYDKENDTFRDSRLPEDSPYSIFFAELYKILGIRFPDKFCTALSQDSSKRVQEVDYFNDGETSFSFIDRSDHSPFLSLYVVNGNGTTQVINVFKRNEEPELCVLNPRWDSKANVRLINGAVILGTNAYYGNTETTSPEVVYKISQTINQYIDPETGKKFSPRSLFSILAEIIP